jgi:hypothetical protein
MKSRNRKRTKRTDKAAEADKMKHQMNAANNYLGVLEVMQRFDKEIAHDVNEPIPENWEQERNGARLGMFQAWYVPPSLQQGGISTRF